MRGRMVDREDALRLWQRGMTLEQFADAVGCSRSTARAIKRDAGMQRPYRRTWGPESAESVAVLLAEGLSLKEAARFLDLSYTTVLRKFRGRGWCVAACNEYRRDVARLEAL